MLTYTVVLRKADGTVFARSVLSKDKDGKSAMERAVEATVSAAGDGFVAQNVNLMPIDIDLTA